MPDIAQETPPPLFAQPDSNSIDERFAEFDTLHPEVFALFRQFALQLLNRGRSRGSADQIIQRIRWETSANSQREEGDFKINDHFSSRYARKLKNEDARFAEFFEFRVLKS